MRFNPDKRFLDKINKINKINKIGLSLSAQGGEEFGPNQMLSNLFLKFCKFCPNLSSVSSVLSVVNSAGFPPFWPVRRGF